MKGTKSERKMLTFQEFREKERELESAHLAPGLHHVEVPFASGLPKVNFGEPYKFKPKEGPGPGEYEESKGLKIVKPKSYEAFI